MEMGQRGETEKNKSRQTRQIRDAGKELEMTAYFCKHCKTMFDDETANCHFEDPSASGITGLPSGYEVYLCCPNCGSEDFEDIVCSEECDECEYAQWCEERI